MRPIEACSAANAQTTSPADVDAESVRIENPRSPAKGIGHSAFLAAPLSLELRRTATRRNPDFYSENLQAPSGLVRYERFHALEVRAQQPLDVGDCRIP